MASKFGLYAYGLVGKSPKQLNILGVDKKNKVYSVGGKGMAVLVSKIDTDEFQDQIKKLLSKLTKTASASVATSAKEAGAVPSGAEGILRSHEDVVDTLMKLTTVVPFKFGTILKDEKAVKKMLREYEDKFKKLLSKFRGRAEWGLKVYTNNQEFKNHLVGEEPRFKDLEEKREKSSRGVAYLLGRKMEEELKDNVAARLSKITELIFQEAGKDAYEARLNKTLPQKLTGKTSEMILNTAYLVEKEKAASFHKQIEKLREKYESVGLEIEISGPWPAYSFVL